MRENGLTPYYERGGVTIYLGDCREILPGLSGVDCIIADPPYGINHDTNYTRFSGGLSQSRNFGTGITGDSGPFCPSHLLGYRRVVLWGANNYAERLPGGSWLIWDKRYNGQDKILSDAEVAWFNHGTGVYIFTHGWNGFLRESERGKTLHPTQKPVVLMAWCIEKAKPQGVICDPYMGSGPTLKAARLLEYPAIGIEIEERYCEQVARELDQLTIFHAVPAEPLPEQLELLL